MYKEEVLFHNYSDEDFSWKYDGQEYTFKAGSITPMEKVEFNHFAKHLIDRELGKKNIKTNNEIVRAEELKKCIVLLEKKEEPTPVIPSVEPVAELSKVEEPQEFAELNEEPKQEEKKPWCSSCDAKGPIKHKKNCPAAKKNAPAPTAK